MAVLSRVYWLPQMRVDTSHMLAAESYAAFDFRAILSAFGGVDKAFVFRGLHASAKTGLTLSFKVADALVLNPKDNASSFYIGLPDDPDVQIQLPANQANLFIEGRFVLVTQAPVSTGFWDPLALTGEDASGDEFSSASDSQQIVVFEISVNTIEFSDDAIPLAFASTNASSITAMQDRRDLMFRLGRPTNALFKYGFATSRGEPTIAGTGVGETDAASPWRSLDATGVRNDKGFKTFKDWADAVMTRIAETAGTTLWYQSGAASSAADNLSLSQLYFDTIGHSIQPQANASFIWKTTGGGLRLCGEGDVAIDSGARQIGLVRWQSNNTGLQWHLGATFTGGSFRSYTSVQFQSPIAADGGNIYLSLEREVPKGSGNPVLWADNSSYSGFTASKSVSGQAGDFTGIALGDYIRKESEGTSKYYLVQKMSDGTVVYQNVGADQNRIADGTIVAVELVDPNDPSGIISSGASEEPLRYFRSHYSNTDLVADTSAATYTFQDVNYYWLGRRLGGLFILRGYGNMQEGEEVPTLDAEWPIDRGGPSDLFLEHTKDAEYDPAGGYRNESLSGNVITIRRRKSDNSVMVPGAGDNTNAWLTYTIATPVGLMSLNDGLWVRLSDTTGGALSNGTVTDATDALNNTNTTDNRWEVRSLANNVVRQWDTRNCFLLARRVVVNSLPALQFFDGTVISAEGRTLNSNTEVTGRFHLDGRGVKSVLFINATDDFVDTDTANFYYDKGLGQARIRTFLVADNAITMTTPADVDFLPNLGAFELTLGGALSTVRVLGDFIVNGNMTAIQTTQVQSEDKLMTLGVGLLVDEAGGGGIELVDATKTATTFATTNTSPDVVITFPAASLAGYVLGDLVGVSPGDGLGGITAGQIGGQYEVVAVLTVVGQATVVGDVLTIRTSGTATSTTSSGTNTPKAFKSPWSIKLGGAAGTYTGVTSWVFRVKGVATAPTLTPVVNYGIVPTAHSTNMLATRIPFVNDDNAGPAGVDSTLNFSSGLVWDNGTSTLTVTNLTVTTATVIGGATTFNGVVTFNNEVHINGSEYWHISATVTASGSVAALDRFIPIDTSANVADITLLLPTADAAQVGRVITFKDIGFQSTVFNKGIILDGAASDLIDGSLTMRFDEYVNDAGSVTLICRAVGHWSII